MKKYSSVDVSGDVVATAEAESVREAARKMGYSDCDVQKDDTATCWVGNDAYFVAEDEA